MILKLQLFVMRSVKWSQLRRIKTCSVSWSRSGSTPSRQETNACSSVSSSLRWQIILNSGTIIEATSGTSSAASSTFKETSRLRGKVQDIPEVSEEARSRILRLVIDKESMSFTDEVKYKKVKLHQFFKLHQVWSAETEMFNISQTASSFMTQHVLYHESVAISNWFLSETI